MFTHITGLDPDEGEEDLLEEEDEDSSGGDPLSQLYDRFAQDKDALLARLRGQFWLKHDNFSVFAAWLYDLYL